jgi:hypothetical protein
MPAKEKCAFLKKRTFPRASGMRSPREYDAGRNGQKFFGSFFQKRTLPFLESTP